MKTHMNRLTRLSMALLTAAAAAGASAATNLPDGQYRYGQLSGGMFSRLHALDHTIDLSTGSLAVVMPGTSHLTNQTSWALGIGRQWHEDKPKDGSEPRYWRLEAEYWGGTAKRTMFESRMLKVPLSDSVKMSGIHVMALSRIARGETSRLWMGAGLGYMNVSVPDANAASPNCACLGGASGSGWSGRVKTLLERDLGEETTGYVEVSYTTVPSVRTANGVVPSVRTTFDSPISIHLGVRRAF